MNLPNEIKNRQWAKDYLAELEKMSDEELFTEAFSNASPDDYDGTWTTRGYWKAAISQDVLRERFLKE